MSPSNSYHHSVVMLRKIVLSALFFLCFIVVNGAPTKSTNELRIGKIEEELSQYRHSIDSLEYGQRCVSTKLEANEALMNHHLDVISNELSASDRFLEYFGVFLTLLSLALGAYVTWMQSRVKKMSDFVDGLEKEITKKRDEIVSIQEQINSSFDELYLRIRRTDTANLVKRLEVVPMDISNTIRTLSVRDLEAEDFDALKNAYKKLIDIGKEENSIGALGPSYGFGYRVLFFQHFLGKAISDDFLRNHIQSDFGALVGCCFENDILKSMSDIAPVLHQRGVAFDRVTLLKDLLLAIRKSEFKANAEVFSILQNGIADDDLWTTANALVEEELSKEE